jgi:uncharacterized protein YndB with AHSA1/START domain
MTKEKITVQAEVSADIKKVWEYYTSPEHITKWNFASDDWHCPSASNNLKPGGKYSARMESKDGKFGFDFEAVYDEVVEEEKIIYTMLDGRKAEVIFNKRSDKTEVIITFDAESEHPVEMQRDGWQAILNNFKKYTEAN